MAKKSVIVIIGPTAIGKTRISIKLAKKLNGEIICADSMQAYRGMDILSQKPTKRDLRTVRHYLVSFLNPDQEYSAAIFAKRAQEKIRAIIRKGKIPIIVGGSGLYVKALVDGIFPSKGKSEAVRKRLQRLAVTKGALFLYDTLKNIDPASAEKIHPNDTKRIIRALEIHEVDKITKTSLRAKTKGIKDKYDVQIFGLTTQREKLYERINKRTDMMFRKGVVREVQRLLRRDLSATSRQALGIKVIQGLLNHVYDMEKIKETLKRDTRRFAKRQLTWFRPDKRIIWLDVDTLGETRIVGLISEYIMVRK